MKLPLPVNEMVKLEMATEHSMLKPVRATKQLIDKLRIKNGCNIVFLTDMYLPSNFIRMVLTDNGLYKEGDKLVVSGEKGVWKYDGTMFHYVKEAEGITYRHWHHWGDNHHSDYIVPRRLGIHAHLLRYDYLYFEQKWQDIICTASYQYPSILAGVSRAIRLSVGTIEYQNNFVSDITAPFITSWICTILNDAQHRNIERIYFCARDMHSHYHIAKVLSPYFPDIEPKYIFISRKSLYSGNPLIIKYLEQEGVASAESVALADAVSSGNTLHTINQLLTQNGYTPIAHFYCINGKWGADMGKGETDKEQFTEDNQHAQYILLDRHIATTANNALERTIENIVFHEILPSLNYHGTTTTYVRHGNTIRPQLSDDCNWQFAGFSHHDIKNNNDSLLTTFADAYAATGLIAYSDKILEYIALPTLVQFIDNPPKVYLHYLHIFQLDGTPFVNKRYRPNRWKRGSSAYTFSSYTLQILRKVKKKLYGLLTR